MKTRIIIFLLPTLVLLTFDFVWGSSDSYKGRMERAANCGCLVSETLPDGTLILSAVGPRATLPLGVSQNGVHADSSPTDRQRSASELFREYNLSTSETIGHVVGLLYRYLSYVKYKDRPLSYEKVDTLFKDFLQLANSAKKSAGHGGWWEEIVLGENHFVYHALGSIMKLAPQRYGWELLALFERLLEQYPEDLGLTFAFSYITSEMIDGLAGVKYDGGTESGRPNSEEIERNRPEIRTVAEKFLNQARKMSHVPYYHSTNLVLELAVPDILRELKQLREERDGDETTLPDTAIETTFNQSPTACP